MGHSWCATLIALTVCCQRHETERAREPHFVDTDGQAHPEFEPAWSELEKSLGSATPVSVTVQFTDDGISRFDGASQRLLVDRRNIARRGNELVGHELTHVALYTLSDGASAEDAFRFMDEGFANIVGARIAGNLEDYKTNALARARSEHARLEEVQAWSVFFGGPTTGRWWTYEVGSSFCFLILDQFGEPALRKLFVEIGRSRDLGQALKAAIGIDYQDVEQRWFAYLDGS